jgi:ribosomal protein L37E
MAKCEPYFKYGMDPKLFQQRLEELAELTVIKEARNSGERMPDEPPEVMRNGQVIEIDRKDNNTWPWAVKKLKTQPKVCDDCGKTVKDRVVSRKLCTYPENHWRSNCSACGLHLNPETRKYDMTATQVNYAWVRFLKYK